MQIGFGAAAAAAMAVCTLAACSPSGHGNETSKSLKAVSSLTCPQTVGDLSLKTRAADGARCDYAGKGGTEVALTLVPVAGAGVDAALAPAEAALRTRLAVASQTAGGGSAATWSSGKGASDTNGAGKAADKVDIDLPGVHIHAKSDAAAAGAQASVNGKDVTVRTSGAGASAAAGDSTLHDVAINAGGVSINAQDKGAEIRISAPGSGVRRMFMLANDKAGPDGFKVGGYQARGPDGGPIVVASFLAKSKTGSGLENSLKSLLAANSGEAH
jgi:hypothetical protein